MEKEIWGADIATPECPEWLTDDDMVWCNNGSGRWLGLNQGRSAKRWHWPAISAIRLPADHDYYKATEKGFTYWPGGENAPDDWDGGDVLRLGDPDNKYCTHPEPWVAPYEHNERWYRYKSGPNFCDIIGYRRKQTEQTDRPSDEIVARMVRLVQDMAWMGEHLTHERYHYEDARAIHEDMSEPSDPLDAVLEGLPANVAHCHDGAKVIREHLARHGGRIVFD